MSKNARFQTLDGYGFVSVVYLGCIGSALAFYWYYDSIAAIGATNTGSFIALVPVSAVLLGIFFLNESLSLIALLGTLFIVTGIMFCNGIRYTKLLKTQ